MFVENIEMGRRPPLSKEELTELLGGWRSHHIGTTGRFEAGQKGPAAQVWIELLPATGHVATAARQAHMQPELTLVGALQRALQTDQDGLLPLGRASRHNDLEIRPHLEFELGLIPSISTCVILCGIPPGTPCAPTSRG